ncbi:MAG: dTDP-4-dehydrorhamnose reductase [Candidatus Omnitrophica bacterium]|nr:dTDP-4-dehydrorhamnose reductase [Candidatus Omnitrophota bacterium]
MGTGEVLLTGATGLLGRALVRHLAADYSVTAVSKSGAGSVVPCDLSEEGSVAALFGSRKLSLAVHAAAWSDVDGCENDPMLAHRVNALGTRHLALECARRRIPLVYISTDYVFDGRKETPYEEKDRTCPVNVYGMTKLEGEHYARLAPRSVVVRTSWLFGAGPSSGFVNAMLGRLKNEDAVQVLDDQVGAPTYAEDLSGAIRRIAAYLLDRGPAAAMPAGGGLFHVCNAGSATRYEMALRMTEWLGLGRVRVEKAVEKSVPGRVAIRPRRSVMSPAHFENFFKERMRPWEESLKDYLNGMAACAR